MTEQTTQEAIQSLYDLYSDDIYRYARLTLGSSSDAYDVVQEVFFRAFCSWSNYRHDATEKTWLMRIARNYIFDLLRKRRTERAFLSSYQVPTSLDEAVSVQAILEIEEALSTMKPEHRQAIILRHVEDLSIQDTARILRWSEAKVRNTTHRAMNTLRERLRKGLHHEVGTRNA